MKRAGKERGHRGLLGACLLFSAVLAHPRQVRADDDSDTVFASAAKALHDGRAGEAIDGFESLADRGEVDPVLSFDRGLAYAMRVRIGAEVPGDLGRAAHGFEEARDLSRDSKLVDEASLALRIVRSEVAKRRARAGDPTEVDPGPSLGRAVAGLLLEDTWAILASIASAVLSLGLFVRWIARPGRTRVTGGVAAGVASPVLAVAIAMTLAARHDRATLREAVVVATSARPSDERGMTRPGATPLPEGARVEVVEVRGPLSRVRFGPVDAWVSSGALRELARRG
jgi:hypothetical protein